MSIQDNIKQLFDGISEILGDLSQQVTTLNTTTADLQSQITALTPPVVSPPVVSPPVVSPPVVSPPVDMPKFSMTIAPAGMATHFDATSLVDDLTKYDFEVDFGDGSEKGIGWNEAHCYDTPGLYTVSYKIMRDGKSSMYMQPVVIPKSTRSAVNVPAGANLLDYNNNVGVDITLTAGATYQTTESFHFKDSILRMNGAKIEAKSGSHSLLVPEGTSRVDMGTFNYAAADDPLTFAHYDMVGFAIQPAKDCSLAVTGCNFEDVSYWLNSNQGMKNVLIEHCNQTKVNGLRAYAFWGEGHATNDSDGNIILGNTKMPFVFKYNKAGNSTNEHCLRTEDWIGPGSIHHCEMSNLAQVDSGIKGDAAKGVFAIHCGHQILISDCTIWTEGSTGGGAGFGPLAQNLKYGHITQQCVLQRCTLIDAPCRADGGTNDIEFRDNITMVKNATFGNTGYVLSGPLDNVRILRCKMTSPKYGQFVSAEGAVTNVTIRGCQWTPPQTRLGDGGNAGVIMPNATALVDCGDNIWEPAVAMYIGYSRYSNDQNDRTAWLTPEQWMKLWPTDTFPAKEAA